jgi:hypothetical protein
MATTTVTATTTVSGSLATITGLATVAQAVSGDYTMTTTLSDAAATVSSTTGNSAAARRFGGRENGLIFGIMALGLGALALVAMML